jgi:integrase
MALTTGARRGELLKLTYGDLDLASGTAYLRTSKNGEPRVLPLVPAVVTEIRRHGDKAADVRLFAARYRTDKAMSFATVWRTAVRQASIEDFRFHDLRHSCASYLAQSGASLVEIADVLGHKSLDVTRRYSHLTVDSKRQLVQRVLGAIGAAA